MICDTCVHNKDNGGECLAIVSSNGHSTWNTPIFPDVAKMLDEVNDWDNCFPPTECAQFKRSAFVVVYCAYGFFDRNAEWASASMPSKEKAIAAVGNFNFECMRWALHDLEKGTFVELKEGDVKPDIDHAAIAAEWSKEE